MNSENKPQLLVFDLKSRKQVAIQSPFGLQIAVYGFEFTTDSRHWSWQVHPSCFASICRAASSWPGSNEYGKALTLAPDGKTIIRFGPAIRFFDAETLAEKSASETHATRIDLAHSRSGRFIVTRDLGQQLRLWDARTGRYAGLAPSAGQVAALEGISICRQQRSSCCHRHRCSIYGLGLHYRQDPSRHQFCSPGIGSAAHAHEPRRGECAQSLEPGNPIPGGIR